MTMIALDSPLAELVTADPSLAGSSSGEVSTTAAAARGRSSRPAQRRISTPQPWSRS